MSQPTLELDEDLSVTAADLLEMQGPRWCQRFITKLKQVCADSLEDDLDEDRDELDFDEEWGD